MYSPFYNLLKCWSVTQPLFWIFAQLHSVTPEIMFGTYPTCQLHHHPPTSSVGYTIAHPCITQLSTPSPTHLCCWPHHCLCTYPVSYTITHPSITWLTTPSSYLLCWLHLHPSILPNHSKIIIRFTIILVHYIHTNWILLILIHVSCTIMTVT